MFGVLKIGCELSRNTRQGLGGPEYEIFDRMRKKLVMVAFAFEICNLADVYVKRFEPYLVR